MRKSGKRRINISIEQFQKRLSHLSMFSRTPTVCLKDYDSLLTLFRRILNVISSSYFPRTSTDDLYGIGTGYLVAGKRRNLNVCSINGLLLTNGVCIRCNPLLNAVDCTRRI